MPPAALGGRSYGDGGSARYVIGVNKTGQADSNNEIPVGNKPVAATFSNAVSNKEHIRY